MITKSINTLLTACLLCGSAVAALSSCSSMMETESELVEFEKDNTLNHPTDSVYSVMGIISKLQAIADRTVLLGEVRADLVQPTEAASADLKRLSAFDLQQANKYNQVSDYYAVVNNCNYYLAHVDTAMQRRGRNLFLPEYAVVKAYRAWTYLQLVTTYGQVPLVLTPVMTEQEAREAMNQPRVALADVCQYFINDLTPLAGVEQPQFGTINDFESRQFFLPLKAVLGDLCLWSGRYEEAARWYHDYLTDVRRPVQMRSSNRITWASTSDLTRPVNGYTVTNPSEALSFIPMEQRVFDGTVSDLPNIFGSTQQNNYYFQLKPSTAMSRLSAAQDYCFEVKTDVRTDTLYAPKTGFQDPLLTGDLRLYANYSLTTAGGRDPYSEYNYERQSIAKTASNMIITYRRSMVYLRYAEALNRCRLPQSAMVVLKYGMCKENVATYVDSLEQKRAGELITFDDENLFSREQVRGIHSLGSGDSQANAHYTLPMPAAKLATLQDTIDYQVPLVEDMIINEMALEGAFEGYRFYDLMRVALRRNDPAYLAMPVSQREGTANEPLRSLLMDTRNWYLPLP